MRNVLLYGLNHSKADTAVRPGMSSRSVLRFSRRYYERGNVCADKPGRPAGSYLLSQQEQAVLIQELLEHPERILSEHSRYVEGVCGARLSVSCTNFRRNRITMALLKKPAPLSRKLPRHAWFT